MLNKVFLVNVILSIVVVSCSPSPKAIERAIAETQTAMPTATVIPTPTQIPLKEIDLSGVIFQTGDLPPGFEPSQVRSELGDLSNIALSPENFYSQSLSHNNKFGGLADILIYEDLENAQNAYATIVPNMPGNSKSMDVGEDGQVARDTWFDTVSFTFVRCHAVVAVQFQGTNDEGAGVSYAKRLDERLQPLVCR